MARVGTPDDSEEWHSKSEFKMPPWGEPLIILLILFSAMFFTRRRNYTILKPSVSLRSAILDGSGQRDWSEDENLMAGDEDLSEGKANLKREKTSPKTRCCCGLVKIHTPSSQRFANHIHSRILQKFPFLVEMFYWSITYAAYQYSQHLARQLYQGEGVWNVAQAHALTVLDIEENSWLKWLLPVHEKTVQQFFMHGHQDLLTFLNRAYSLIHIPGTVGFIAWYYYAAPSHHTFAIIRRTLTWTNYLAFIIFILYPVMPPRLLPKEYGYLDTVHHDSAESVWMSGRFVNQLAAMPSMHFGYALAIGCTFIWHSGVFRTRLEKYEVRKNKLWKTFYCAFGIAYPSLILLIILATANHYWLDAIVAAFCVVAAFLTNRICLVLLPAEDWLLFVLRLEKPVPSTGERFHAKGGRL